MGEGGLAPWPSPKPVRPQHLETIIGTIFVVQTWLLGSAAVHSESRGMGQPHLLLPPPHQCLPWHQHMWLPIGSVVGNSQPELQTCSLMARVGAPGCSRVLHSLDRSQAAPAQLLTLPATSMAYSLASWGLSFSVESIKSGLAASYVVACVVCV